LSEPLSLLIDEGGAVRRVKVDRLPASVGRDDDCDVVLADPAASRRHARFEATDHGCAIVDLGSSNGTLLDGVRVRRALLRRGAEIRIGEAKIVFAGGGPVPEARPDPAEAAIAARVAASAAASAAAEPARQRAERSGPDAAGDGASDGENPAEPYVPPPPASAKTKAFANLLTVAILIGANVGVYFVWKTYFRPEPKPAFVYVDERSPATAESRKPAAPVDPDAVAAEAWRGVSAEVDELAAAEKFEGAFNLLKAFVSTHAGAPTAMQALERIGQVRRLRDEWVGNCLDNAERSLKDGALSTARMSLDRARKIAGNDAPPRLAELAAAVEAAAAKNK
jgi:predicted component of type VI protein secretion system